MLLHLASFALTISANATLQCREGEVIKTITSANYTSDCNGDGGNRRVGSNNVIPQVQLLCRGLNSCQVECSCKTGISPAPSPPAPSPPAPPAPPAPQPVAPKGFHPVTYGASKTPGSCRDMNMKEPPFFGSNEPVTLADCESSCGADPGCTAISYCAEKCTGSCHIYTSTRTAPSAHPDWKYDPAQGGVPTAVDTVMPNAPWWWCFAKDLEKDGAEDRSQLSNVPAGNRGARSSECVCTSNQVDLAFPPPPPFPVKCTYSQGSLVAKAECIPNGPPPAPPPAPATTGPTNLRLQFLEAPVLGVDLLRPQFGWTPPSNSARMQPTDAQASAEVVVYDHQGTAIWSSGIVNGSTPAFVPPADHPLPLKSDSFYSWTVTTYTAADAAPHTPRGLAGAEVANFTTGLLAQSDWGAAKWIVGGSMFRKEFTVAEAVVPARVSVFVSACQYYIMYVDGIRIGDRELDVAWTKFGENRSYSTYNLPPALFAPGKHVVGLEVGEGFCGGNEGKAGANRTRAALLLVNMHSNDKQSLIIQSMGTDGTWESSSGPVLYDSTYYGEDYDARLEQPGWSLPGFRGGIASKSKQWVPAQVQVVWPVDDTTRAGPPNPPWMSSQLMQPIKVVRTMQPISVSKISMHQGSATASSADQVTYVYDFAQEFAGVVQLRLPPMTASGTNITLKYAEALAHPGLAAGDSYDGGGGNVYDGRVYMKNLFWAHPEDTYTARGGSPEGEVWQPRFTEHGFRYVQLTVENGKLPEEPSLNTILGVNLRTAAKEQSSMHFGSPLLQSLSDNSWWGEAAALMSIPNGAAGRGERAGWTGDSAFASESECFDFDTGAFFAQFMNQIRDGQCADGTIGDVVPSTDPRRDGPLPYGGTCQDTTKDATWDTVYPTIAHNLWQYYGATGVVADHWDHLKLYMNMLERKYNETANATANHKPSFSNYFCRYGDWNPVKKTPCPVTSSASFLHDLLRMSEMAKGLGKQDDAEYYSTRFETLKPEWHKAFWNPVTSSYSTGTQMAQAVAIWLGIVPSELMPRLVKRLAAEVVNHGVTIGFVGVRYLFEALAKQNQIKAALECIARPGYPGYFYEIYNKYEPATTLWESWNVDTQTCITCETSRNHHYSTSINTFLRKYVAGLTMPDGVANWDIVKVRPEAAVAALGAASSRYLNSSTMRGSINALPSSASVTVETHRGTIHVAWSVLSGSQSPSTNAATEGAGDIHNLRESPRLYINVTVPSGGKGEIHVPRGAGGAIQILESGQVIFDEHSEGLSSSSSSSHRENPAFRSASQQFVVFESGSGNYYFEVVTLPEKAKRRDRES